MIKFEHAKLLVLRATYETLVFSAEYETFKSEEIHKLVAGSISHGYVCRILKTLAQDELVSIDTYDESSPLHYTLTDKGIKEAEELWPVHVLLANSTAPDDGYVIPSSDGVVRLDHNSAPYQKVREVIEEAKVALAQNNAVGEALGDDKPIAKVEIEVLEKLISQPEFRRNSVLNLARTSLTWIAEKGVGTIIGELAKKLLALIIEIMS